MPLQVQRYVTKLLVEILGPAEIEKRFDWSRGDSRKEGGRGRMLPFDAVWEARKLIVEVDERQHGEAVGLFDKPHKMTVSGVHRGEQRKRYDERKGLLAADHGYKLVRLSTSLFGQSPRRILNRGAGDGGLIMEFLREQGVGDLPVATRAGTGRVH